MSLGLPGHLFADFIMKFMRAIKSAKLRQILDSRGFPTVECDIFLDDGSFGRASVPSGASTGSREAVEKRDGDASYYLGKSVSGVISDAVSLLIPNLLDIEFVSQAEFDHHLRDLDGTSDKSGFGANILLAFSLAFARASSKSLSCYLYRYFGTGKHIPTPMFNIINGGVHADNALAIQEFMIIPTGISGIGEQIRAGAEVYHNLRKILKRDGKSCNIGDEGGFAPAGLGNTTDALKYINLAISEADYTRRQISIGLDAAANEFFSDGKYHIDGHQYSSSELVAYYRSIIDEFKILSIEDPMAESDTDGWKLASSSLGDINVIGDDIFVTNTEILRECIDSKIGNAVLIKPNQVGTITETIKTIYTAKEAGYKCVVSHRSGETEDNYIAHLAVGCSADYIKAGAPARGERTIKYNELLRIEETFLTPEFSTV